MFPCRSSIGLYPSVRPPIHIKFPSPSFSHLRSHSLVHVVCNRQCQLPPIAASAVTVISSVWNRLTRDWLIFISFSFELRSPKIPKRAFACLFASDLPLLRLFLGFSWTRPPRLVRTWSPSDELKLDRCCLTPKNETIRFITKNLPKGDTMRLKFSSAVRFFFLLTGRLSDDSC
jgi:hypothetical protein